MKKFGIRLLTAVAASSMIVTPVMAAPSVDSLEENKAAAQSEVSSLQSQLTELLTKAGELEEDLIAKGEEIIEAKEDLKAAEEKEEQQYEDMKLRIKYMYEKGDASMLVSLIESDSFADLVNKAEYIQNVHTYDRKMLDEYVETTRKIDNLKTTLEDEQKEMETLQTEYEAQGQELSNTIESKKDEVANLDAQIQAAAEAAAREAAERQAAEEAANNGGNDGENGGAAANGGNGGATTNNGGGTTNNGGGNTGSTGGGNVSAPSGNTSAAQIIVNAAYSQLGVPYVYGGSTPGAALDCSGLTQYCHRVAGISIARTSQAQGGGGKAVSNPQPGDLVCYGTHVGIYIGGNQMIHAPHTGDVVRVASVYGSPWYRRYW